MIAFALLSIPFFARRADFCRAGWQGYPLGPANRPVHLTRSWTNGCRLGGRQSWLQPAFSRLSRGAKILASSKSRLKGGCRQDCLPHRTARVRVI